MDIPVDLGSCAEDVVVLGVSGYVWGDEEDGMIEYGGSEHDVEMRCEGLEAQSFRYWGHGLEKVGGRRREKSIFG